MVNLAYKLKNNRCFSFGSIERTVYNDKQEKNIKYRNNTYLFRDDLFWKEVIDNITKDDKPKKIYCYACSDGSEPYSIAIALISRLGWDKAQKYFPIIARDIDEKMINKAKSGKLAFDEEELVIIRYYQRNSDTKFFDIIYDNISYDSPFHKRGILSEKLKSCIDFAVGDICEEASNIDYSNSVIFFRNAMPYIPKEKREKLLAVFSRNLKKTTAIVIGEYDKRMLLDPLSSVYNSFYGLIETTKNYYEATRKKNIKSKYKPIQNFSLNSNLYDKFDNINTDNVKIYNKYIKNYISNYNRKNKCRNNEKYRYRFG